MFKKLFCIFGRMHGRSPADATFEEIRRIDQFEKLPADIRQLDKSYRQLIRELGKR